MSQLPFTLETCMEGLELHDGHEERTSSNTETSPDPNADTATLPHLSMFVDAGNGSDDDDAGLYGELKLRTLARKLGRTMSDYTAQMQAFAPSDDTLDTAVQHILRHGNAMLSCALKVCSQSALVERYSARESKDAQQALDLAEQVLLLLGDSESSSCVGDERRSVRAYVDFRLRHLADVMGVAIVRYNGLLRASPPAGILHDEIEELDARAEKVVGIAVDQYDEAIQARRVCDCERRGARERVGLAMRVLGSCRGSQVDEEV